MDEKDNLEDLFNDLPEIFRKYFESQGLSPRALNVEDISRRRLCLKINVPIWDDYEYHKKEISKICEGDASLYEKSIHYLINALAI